MHYVRPFRIPLAVEIEENIIDQLQGDRYMLYRCALVCHAWYKRSRIHLFRDIRVGNQNDVDGLCHTFREHPWLRTYVRSVAIRPKEEGGLCKVGFMGLIVQLPHLRCLDFEAYFWEIEMIPYHPRDLDRLRGSAIEVLSLYNIKFPTSMELLRLIRAFLCLREFRCKSVKVEKHGRGSASFLERVSKHLRLHRLSLQNMNAEVAELLLEVTKSTVRDLEMEVDESTVTDLHPLVQLRSLKLRLPMQSTHTLAKSIRHTNEIVLTVQTLALHHCCIELHLHKHYDPQIVMSDSEVINTFHTLEETLLGLSSRAKPVTVVVKLTGLRPHDVGPLRTVLPKRLPKLVEQGALTLLFHDEGEPALLSGQYGHHLRDSLQVSPSGLWVVSCTWDRKDVFLWRVSGDGLGAVKLHWTRPVLAAAVSFSPDSQHLAAALLDTTGGVVRVYDVSSGAVVQDLRDSLSQPWEPRDCAWSPDQAKLAAVNPGGVICVWNTHPSWQLLFRIQLPVHDEWPSLLFSHDSRSLLSWGDKGASLIDCAARTARTITTAWLFIQPSFDPQDSHLLVVARHTPTGIVQILNLTSHEEPVLLEGHMERVLAVSLSLDGAYILSASEDSTVKTWDASTGIELVSFGGSTDLPLASIVAFTPDRRHVTFGYEDGTLRLFRVSDGECVGMSAEHKAEITNIVYSADGNILCSGDHDGTICTHQIGHLCSLV